MEVKGVVAVSWNLVPASRATTAICLGSPYLYHLSFVQAERQLLVLCVIIVCAVAPREARHGTRRPDRVCATVRAGQSSRVGRMGHVPSELRSS